MKKKSKTIQSSLFFTYSLIILITFTILVTFFYLTVSDLLKTNAFESIDSLSNSILEKLDMEIRDMDSVSMRILYSNLVKERFAIYNLYANLEENNVHEIENKIDRLTNIKELIDIFVAIIGPSNLGSPKGIQQINLYSFNGGMIGTGTDSRTLDISVNDAYWYEEVITESGKKFLTKPHTDERLAKFNSSSRGKYYISLCRVFFGPYNSPQGILEVKKYYDTIFESINSYLNQKVSRESVYVYDKQGCLIYPYSDNSQKVYDYYQVIEQNTPEENSLTIRNPLTKENELINYKYSDYTGWTVIVAVSEAELLKPLHKFTKITFIVALMVLFLGLLLSFTAAKKLTTPISKLNKAIKSLNWNTISSSAPKELNSGLNELEELNWAFQKMNVELKRSIDDMLLAKSHEMQARMLALQSQMNPHFLYNTLATVSVMAEENMNEQIISLCDNMSYMLRYISSDDSSLVGMKTEIEYTLKYLECIKMRYGDDLQYNIHIAEKMEPVKIPKLVIQPLVENALKYGTNKKPPWRIQIEGTVNKGFWKVLVIDNGPGFNEESLEFINKKIHEINKINLLPSLELDGMGLLNIYMRLKLTYKDKMIFKIYNIEEGGACVTIGGEIRV